MKYELLENGIAKISLDNGKVNAVSSELSDAVMEALSQAESEAKAVLICGHAGMFSAGFDLKVIAQGPQQATAMIDKGMLLLERIYSHPQPVIIACEGHAIGMGVFLLLAADYRVGATGEFMIKLPETEIGMPFTPTLKVVAKSHIDSRFHARAIIQSTGFSPEQAANIGMLDEVVAADEVMVKAIAVAEKLAALPSEQYKINKLDMRSGEIAEIRQSLNLL